jgi:hypothetical protein
VRQQLERACPIVSERRAGIERLVAQLLERDTLVGSEIRACFADAPAAPATSES